MQHDGPGRRLRLGCRAPTEKEQDRKPTPHMLVVPRTLGRKIVLTPDRSEHVLGFGLRAYVPANASPKSERGKFLRPRYGFISLAAQDPDADFLGVWRLEGDFAPATAS